MTNENKNQILAIEEPLLLALQEFCREQEQSCSENVFAAVAKGDQIQAALQEGSRQVWKNFVRTLARKAEKPGTTRTGR